MNSSAPRTSSRRRERQPDRSGGFGSFDDDSGAGSQAPGHVPSLVLITGPEQVLAQRAIDATLAALRAADPLIETIRCEAVGYEPGLIARHASPSLFGGTTALVVLNLDEAGDDLLTDLSHYLDAPAEHVRLIVWHKGGNRGKRVLDHLKKSHASVLTAPAIKSDRDKSEFVNAEFARARRGISTEAVRALVEAVGKDVRELASACSQLIADTSGPLEEADVAVYYGGRISASGFRVADAALAGDAAQALTLTRHALAVGTDPVPIVAALANSVRQLVKVAGAGPGSSASLAGQLGMAPWQIDRARRSVRGWSPQGLALAVTAIAAADFEVKGGGRDPVYAVEHCILEIVRARGVAQARRG